MTDELEAASQFYVPIGHNKTGSDGIVRHNRKHNIDVTSIFRVGDGRRDDKNEEIFKIFIKKRRRSFGRHVAYL